MESRCRSIYRNARCGYVFARKSFPFGKDDEAIWWGGVENQLPKLRLGGRLLCLRLRRMARNDISEEGGISKQSPPFSKGGRGDYRL